MKKIHLILFFLFSFVFIAWKQDNDRSYSPQRRYKATKAEYLTPVTNTKKLRQMESSGYLKKITNKVSIAPNLRKDFRYCKPLVNDFLDDMANAFSRRFGKSRKIQINSAVRTVEYQKQLRKVNSNASKHSTHPLGNTVDIAKKNLSSREKEWVRLYLRTLKKKKVISMVEEKNQAIFHVKVSKNYLTYKKNKK